MNTSLLSSAQALFPSLIQWRRILHRFPEQGWMEVFASAYIAGELRRLGFSVLVGEAVCETSKRLHVPDSAQLMSHTEQVRTYAARHPTLSIDPADLSAASGGHTGVIGTLACGDGPVIALRFDMDALPISEETAVSHLPAAEGFASAVSGSMHACGHDGHMAIGLGTASLLARYKDQLHGTIRLIFQPAEEGVRGAGSIVAAGHLDDADYLLAGHIKGSGDDSFFLAPGMEGTLATTKLRVIFNGRSSHAAMAPQDGCNALTAAACAVLNLQAIPRHADGSSRINVGSLHAGSSANVICDRAELLLEVRGETSAINQYMESSAIRVLEHAASMYGCSVEIQTTGTALTVLCSPDLTDTVRSVCENTLRLPVRVSPGLNASEDFSLMTDHVLRRGGRTCFIGIHVPTAAPLHNTRFDFDEQALLLGTAAFAETVRTLLAPASVS